MTKIGKVLALVLMLSVMLPIYTVPAMAQTQQEMRQAAQLFKMAEDAGIAVPSDPEARMQLAARYGISISPEVAAMDAAELKSGNPKATPKDKGSKKALPNSGGPNLGSLLGLGVGVVLIGGALVTHRSIRRRG